MAEDLDVDVRVPSPLHRLRAWFGPPRDYRLTRWLVVRLLGVIYVFAFLGIVMQQLPLLGAHGLTPAQAFVDRLHAAGQTFIDVPSVFMWSASDRALEVWAYIGLAIALAVAVGYANLPMLLALWLIYGSYERIGQVWWGFGWEIQLLETTLIAAFLVHPWDPRPLAARSPPVTSIVLMRWLVFRIMLGAGLIKLRGAACWTDLTCLDAHFETQPIPNPLSAWFHHLPHAVHAVGVVLNHVVELGLPWLVFGPRRLRLIAAAGMAAFQIVLVLSGNLAFLNWLTLVPVLACFDDDALLALVPRRPRAWLRAKLAPPIARDRWQLLAALVSSIGVFVILGGLSALRIALGLTLISGTVAGLTWPSLRRGLGVTFGKLDVHQLAVGCFAALVIVKSAAVVDNLTSHHQAMNTSYDRLALVNTYGAFGSVDMVRHELVIEGTMADDAAAASAGWLPYELPCKPGELARRPCVLGPYHRRLDWLIWFAAMPDRISDPWLLHLVWKLLDGDPTVRELFDVDPFDGKPPRWVRIRRFVYHLQPLDAADWWARDSEELWLPPVSLTTPGLREALGRYGWPSPSDRD